MISANAFVEWAQFSGNYYGTSYQELEVVKASNRIPILDVDIRGVMNLKKIHFFAKYIFVTTPSFAILVRLCLFLVFYFNIFCLFPRNETCECEARKARRPSSGASVTPSRT